MKGKPLLLIALAVGVSVAVPGGRAAASPAVGLVISHVVSHCHVWKTSTRTLGPSTRITLKRGARVVIRSDCPMDFDFAQTKGPRLDLGDPRTYAGTVRVITFRSVGVYRLTVTNVQAPEERGLVTLGTPNVLALTVVVTR